MFNVEERNCRDIKLNPNNPRQITEKQFDRLKKSISEFRQMLYIRPIIIDKNNVVLAGNMRMRACLDLKFSTVPCIRVDDLTEDQKNELIIKDNVGYGEWDWDILANEWDQNLLSDWGLDIPEVIVEESILETVGDDDVPESAPPITVKGDLYELGLHRVMCGDSTMIDNVEKLMDGAEPYLMITDPPYGVEYDPNWRNDVERSNGKKIGGRAIGKVSNDDKADWTDAWSITPAKVAYVYHAGKFSGIVQKSLENCNFEIRSQIIWVKSNFSISRVHYHWKHEPVWYAVKKDSSAQFIGDRKQTTVWEIDKPMKSETGHSTQKPIECMNKPIMNHKGDVHDPFLGSGSTLIACEKTKRKCYGMEMEPKYCDIIVKRYVDFCKKNHIKPKVKRNGQECLSEFT